jgi:hypothetical protein
VLKSIEALPPGLYGMEILERARPDGGIDYEVQFVERRLEEVAKRLNRFKRMDEKPFEEVEKLAQFNQYAYELFARPLVEALSSRFTADLGRRFHPLRVQNWAISELNPWLSWLVPAAEMVRSQRLACPQEAPARQIEQYMSKLVSASLDFYRDMRDAASEALFFEIFGNLLLLRHAGQPGWKERRQERLTEPEVLPIAKDALATIDKGAYPEAVARVSALLARHGDPVPLDRLHLRRELIEKFASLLPETTPIEQRRIRGTQEIIVQYEPNRALQTLPQLLASPGDRERLKALLEGVLADQRVWERKPTEAQLEMLRRIRALLANQPAGRRVTPRRNRTARTRFQSRTPSRRRKNLWKV